MWCKALDKILIANEVEWWESPRKCLSPGKSLSYNNDMVSVFRVHGVRQEERTECGGLLVMKGREVRTLFPGPVAKCGIVSIALCAVKVVLEIFKKAGWARKSALVVELENKLLNKWLVNTLRRPWGIVGNFAEIDSLVCYCLFVRFQFADRMNSSLAAHFAQDGFNRKEWLIAWW
ncbi:hypothetical protein V6N13_083242 [Hibiscus sabdariffa]